MVIATADAPAPDETTDPITTDDSDDAWMSIEDIERRLGITTRKETT